MFTLFPPTQIIFSYFPRAILITASHFVSISMKKATKNDSKKRAAKESDEVSSDREEVSSKEPKQKKVKTTTTSLPLNTKMPEELEFQKPSGTIKLASWNVSSLRAALKKGYHTYVDAEDADILCLQETKVNEKEFNAVDTKKYKYNWWGFEKKKGYGGIALFSKIEPISVVFGLSTHPDPEITKGRVITLEFETLYYVTAYVPNAGEKLVRLKERETWDEAMKEYLTQLDEKKPVIWAGDMNVAHKEIDLARPATNQKTAGFTKEERTGFDKILNGGKDTFIDTWRHMHPDTTGGYTYYSYRFQCRTKGLGWRLDYHVVSKRLLDRVIESEIRNECYGASDHVPIVLILKGESI
ncbi:9042_t:CDS:2 [Dentiscutata erythropus]|uniref:DNA-(apurinic or apyrimidinic site) endonuclease n=1 Tax=Dentiscutata erythropus TaxID=1348616 RepID=A0A9N9NRS5_9GLOM|nr:9042_t:CDS:2 [Dentiscutata erythropus]